MSTRKTNSSKSSKSSKNGSRKSKKSTQPVAHPLEQSVAIFENDDSDKFIKSLSKPENTALQYYQNGSFYINNFLRNGYRSFTGKKQKEITDILKKIALLDKIFTNANCPKMENKRILYRGTEQLYSGINKGFVSCSKTIDALMEMQFVKGDRILSLMRNCCINILIVDKNIPYLDLENYNERWKYQKEVLLPRGLNTTIIEEDVFTYKNIAFKVYKMNVTMNDAEYNAPPLPEDDRIKSDKIKFLLKTQRDEIIKLSNMFIEPSDWTDEKEDMQDLLEYMYHWSEKGISTQSEYTEICKKILTTLQSALPKMKESEIVKEKCKKNLDGIIEKVNEIMNTEEKNITPENYIKVEKC
jgi:hypothetical protein